MENKGKIDFSHIKNEDLFDNWEELQEKNRIQRLRRRKTKRLANLKKRMKSKSKRKQYYKSLSDG